MSCHGGCFSEAVMDSSSLGLDPGEQHHGAHGCTNATKAFSWPRSVLIVEELQGVVELV